MFSSSLFLVAFAALAVARTDLSGCVSSETVRYGGASLLWYVPGTGEVCEFLDCGGGRAPPKTTVPGCAAYEGTETYSPSFIQLAASTPEPTVTSTQPSSAMITGAETTAETSAESTEAGIAPSATASESQDQSSTITEVATLTTSTVAPVGPQATGSSNSTTAVGGSSSGNSTTTAPISSVTDNAAAIASFNGVIGVMAAVFAFIL